MPFDKIPSETINKYGEAILNKFIEELSEIAVVEKKPVLEGKTMFIILSKKI